MAFGTEPRRRHRLPPRAHLPSGMPPSLSGAGAADVMVAGGAEAAICRTGIAGFAACSGTLQPGSTTNRSERPVPGPPAGRFRHGRRRRRGDRRGVGARPAARRHDPGRDRRLRHVRDAHHVTAPSPDGDGARRAMEAALASAELAPSGIDYVNAHGTSTPAGDEIEIAAMKAAFGGMWGTSWSPPPSPPSVISSAPPERWKRCFRARHPRRRRSTNSQSRGPDQDFEINLVPFKAQRRPVRAALSNSFGFGGTNASLVLTAPSRLKRPTCAWGVPSPFWFSSLSAAALAGGIALERSFEAPVPSSRQPLYTSPAVRDCPTLRVSWSRRRRTVCRLFSAPRQLAPGRIRSLKAGEYVIPVSASMEAIYEKIRSGEVLQRKVLIPEGSTAAEVVATLAENPFLSGSAPEATGTRYRGAEHLLLRARRRAKRHPRAHAPRPEGHSRGTVAGVVTPGCRSRHPGRPWSSPRSSRRKPLSRRSGAGSPPSS